jgi:protein-disulfide isomerase
MEPITQNSDNISLTINKTYLYVALALFVGFGGGIGAAKAFLVGAPIACPIADGSFSEQTEDFPRSASYDITQLSTAGRPSLGRDDAPVTIVEFTDYQCPFCRNHFREILPQVIHEYQNEIKYVVFNFPLTRIHPHAQKAAEAVECAHEQSKFWEYRALLFQNQQKLDAESLKQYGTEIGLAPAAFNTCIESGAKEQQVLRDYLEGKALGVHGTPTFFINGKRMSGAQPLDSFQTLIEAALGK